MVVDEICAAGVVLVGFVFVVFADVLIFVIPAGLSCCCWWWWFVGGDGGGGGAGHLKHLTGPHYRVSVLQGR